MDAVFFTGLNLGLRYDEVTKLRVEWDTITSGGINLRTGGCVKNERSQRTYTVEEWPGVHGINDSILLEQFSALLSWMTVRGPQERFLFCDVRNNRGINVIDCSSPMTAARFTKVLRTRLESIGVGSCDVAMYSGHSLKRGCVQLLRSLGLREEYVVQKYK